MKKYLLAIVLLLNLGVSFAQPGSFDVFTYQSPEFFIKQESPSMIRWNMKNNDTSFCVLTIYKSQPAQTDLTKDVMSQWSRFVVKQLSKANKKPTRILTETMWDGWASTLAIGNFCQANKKCVVLLYSFRKDKRSACAVYAFSDKIFKGPVETFSRSLHLKK